MAVCGAIYESAVVEQIGLGRRIMYGDQRKDTTHMRKWYLLLIIAGVLLMAIPVLCETGAQEKQGGLTLLETYPPVESVGDVPVELLPMLDQAILYDGVRIGDRYCVTSTEDHFAIVRIYDLQGTLQNEVRYDIGEGKTALIVRDAVQTLDGYAVHVSSHERDENGVPHDQPPIIIYCSQDGREIWRYTYENANSHSVISMVCTEQGEIVAAGKYTVGKSGKNRGPWTVYILKLSRLGDVVAERRYGGSDFDYVSDMVHVPGAGVFALIQSQSKDGTFCASKDGYPQPVIFRMNESLDIVWQRTYDSLHLTDLHACGDALVADGIDIVIIGFDGERINEWSRSSADRPDLSIAWTGDEGIYAYRRSGIYRMDTWDSGHMFAETPNGYFDSIHAFDDIIIIVTCYSISVYLHPLGNTDFADTDLVYSAFDHDGNLVWRYVVPHYRNLQ